MNRESFYREVGLLEEADRVVGDRFVSFLDSTITEVFNRCGGEDDGKLKVAIKVTECYEQVLETEFRHHVNGGTQQQMKETELKAMFERVVNPPEELYAMGTRLLVLMGFCLFSPPLMVCPEHKRTAVAIAGSRIARLMLMERLKKGEDGTPL